MDNKGGKMSGLNQVTLIGRLGKEPESKKLPGGAILTKFSIATSEKWMGKDGQQKQATEWHNIVTWNKLAEICEKHLRRGQQVSVIGKLKTNSWTTEAGEKRFATTVSASQVLFLSEKVTDDNGNFGEAKGAKPVGDYVPQDTNFNEPEVEDLPF